MKSQIIKNQIIPIVLTGAVCAGLVVLLYGEILIINRFTKTDIAIHVGIVDIVIGLTIYLKTSIDFAIYIAHLMGRNSGWRSRVAIEIGTALGNAAGTFAILLLWALFKEVRWLLAIMIALAALVLFKLAEEGLEHAHDEDKTYPAWFRRSVHICERILQRLNRLTLPLLKYILPDLSIKGGSNLTFWPLFALSFTVPFILGLDDFAGYVPLFNIVNVFGFATGVFVGHMILNILLYLSPTHTVKAVKNPWISFAGSIAFVVLGLFGFTEVARLIGH